MILLLASKLGLANEDRNNKDVIKEYILDPTTVYNIPIGNAPTTIAFPSALSSIDGANISAVSSIEAPVLLSYQEGKYFFSVKAVKPNAQAAINVVFKEQTYAFNFFHREDAIPYRTVRLVRAEEPVTAGQNLSSRPQVSHKITPQALLGILDRAKSYHLVNAAYPGKLDDEVEHVVPAGLSTPYRDFEVNIDEIFRFKNYDTIVFRITLRNTTGEEIFYQPQTVAVRIAQNLYYPSIADASGIIPALSESVAYIAISGKPNGQQANLSLKNAFQIIVSRIVDPAKLLIP